MPQILPGPSDAGLNLQQIKVVSPPTAPYVLTATIVLPPESTRQQFAVRKSEDGGGNPTDWFYTETERIARIHGRVYYEIKAYIDSGAATTFKVDRLDGPNASSINYTKLQNDGTSLTQPGALVDATAQQILWAFNGLRLEVMSPAGPGLPAARIDSVSLGSGYGLTQGGDPAENLPEARMWSNLLQSNGWYRRGKIIQTLYKHVPVRQGGSMGYMHIFATIFPWAEIQFDINWHNAGHEERQVGFTPPVADAGDLEITDPNDQVTDLETPLASFGSSRARDILFHGVRLEGLSGLPPHPDGLFTQWVFTPAIREGSTVSDPAMRVSTRHVVKPISDTDGNRVHCIPITFERPMRFSIHGDHVTPYTKHVVGVQDWSKDLGGWHFTPLGLPDLTAMGAAVAGMSLEAEGAAAKAALRTLAPWRGDEISQEGYVSGDPFWPGSWSQYGGLTSGNGMTPFQGAKQAWLGSPGGWDILECHKLRDRARTYGALYYQVSGIPALAKLHAPNNDAPWSRFDRRFLPGGGSYYDEPFRTARLALPRQVHLADYNPGPSSAVTPTDAQREPTINTPDWYSPGEGLTPLTLDTLTVGTQIPLANFSQTLGYTPPPGDLTNIPGSNSPDLAVPVIFRIGGATTYGSTKSITFRIVGAGEFDVEVTEDVVFAGTGTSPNAPSVQAKSSLGKFKNVREIEVIAVSGTPVSTETISIGRQGVGVADYAGSNGISALDDQHAVRYLTALKSLFILRNDPLAFVYLMMDGADARLTYWDGTGRARRLSPVENGAVGRGNNMTRQWAFAADRIATAIAISHSVSNPATIDTFWDGWRQSFRTAIVNAYMSGPGLFQAPFGQKETANPPFSSESFDFDNGNDSKFMHFVPTRETSYFSYALLMMGYVYGHFDQGLLDICKAMARCYQDLLWKTSGGTARGPHAYMAIAYRRDGTQQTANPRTGALENRIKRADEFPLATDLWTIFSNQAGLPTENPLSKVPFHPASYPTPTVDRFVAAITGTNAALGGGSPTGAMSALTIANAAADASSTPVTVTLRATGTTFSNSDPNKKRRTFKVTGTDPWGVPIDDDCLAAERAGDTLVVGGAITVLAHSFPVASRIGVTVLGGTTFLYNPQAGSFDRVTVRIAGTRIDGSSFTEDVVCAGQGTPKQFFRSSNYFKTVTSITVTAIQGTLLSTEKFRVGTRQTYLVVNGNGGATQDHRLWQYFKTITEVIALTNAQATEHGFSNIGTLVVGETFAFGFQAIGLRQSIPGGGLMDGDAFQTAYALACWKFLGATEADELIKRHCNVDDSQGGADTLAAAKAAMLTWTEYPSNPNTIAPYVQWAPLLWAIRNA